MSRAPGGILALDLATRTGWAYGLPGANELPSGGVWQLPPPSVGRGRQFAEFRNTLSDAVAEMRPRLVFMAAAIGKVQTSAAFLFTLAGVVEMVCFDHDVRVRQEAENTVRVAVFGKGGSGGRRPELKARAMAWARAEGIEPVDDNHADALVMLRFACGMAAGRFGFPARG